MADVQVGVVKNFFAKPSVAAIEMTDGEFQVGDVLWFKGFTTDFKQVREKDLVFKVAD